MMPMTITMRMAPLLIVGAVASANCFSPKINEGVSCGEGASCPAGMQCDIDQRCRFELLAQGNLRVIPDDFEFGSVIQGNPSSPSAFVVLNLALAPTSELQIELQGSDQFEITRDNCAGQILERDDSCTITGRFKPDLAGAHASTLTVRDLESGAISEWTGTALEPGDLQFMPSDFEFDDQPVGIESPPVTFTLMNTGDSEIGAPVLQNPDEDPIFNIVSNGCIDAGPLSPGATCAIEATFKPTLAGNPAFTLIATSESGGSATTSMSGFGKSTIRIEIPGSEPDGGRGRITSNPAPIDCGDTCQGEFFVGSVTLTPIGENGFTFENWELPGSCMGKTICTLDMDQELILARATWGTCKDGDFLRCDGPTTLVKCTGGTIDEEIIECGQHDCSFDLGRCTECEPGETICSINEAGIILVCNEDGLFEACTAGECMDNSCAEPF
jgi:hypothetical protein